MKSEYIACTAAVQEAIWLRNYLLCLDVTKHAYETTVIYCDNTAAILFFSTNIIPWAVQRTDHDLLLGEGMYRDKMVGEVGTNTFHSNPYRCGWTRLHAKTVYSNIFSLTAPSTYFSIQLLLSQSITNRILAIHVRLASIFYFFKSWLVGHAWPSCRLPLFLFLLRRYRYFGSTPFLYRALCLLRSIPRKLFPWEKR